MFLDKFIMLYSHLIQPITLTLLPPCCLLCGTSTRNPHYLCSDCYKDLPISTQNCPRCAQKLHSTSATCGACLNHPPPFDETHALFPYQAPITHLITKLKFQHQLSHAKALGTLFCARIQEHWYQSKPLPDLLLPVPLHPARLQARGFNQAVEIAKPIAKHFAIPLDLTGVRRIKPTAAQSGLSARQRKQNVAHAFDSNEDYTDRSLAVIDDVMTTGHTLRELCQLLKKKGAKHLTIWCVARNE